ncbi:MAG: UDP-N-acetylmuramate--L-alanine ligase [Thalassobius sp.]|nr:UDP-N-acetylmuramate--L-alanine ligase [Thalassovita sp.]
MSLNLQNIEQVYLIGVGGIGMSALARWFKANGREVWGYDKVQTALTDALEKEGIPVHFDDKVSLIPEEVLDNDKSSLIIFTPAVPVDHKQLNFLRDAGYHVMKRSQVLGLISTVFFTVAVAGTHGKTTTSSMLAHMLHHTGQPCSAFVGGIAKNFESNLLMSNADLEEQVLVVEADEYDRSFLTLNPDIAVITSVEPDHLDIYGDDANLKEAFIDFIGNIKGEGQLFIRKGAAPEIVRKLQANTNIRTFGLGIGDYAVENVRPNGQGVIFDLVNNSEDDSMDDITDLELNMPGEHNMMNMAAAVAAALSIGLQPEKIRKAVAAYSGVRRRFDFVVSTEDKIYIDDYAHHPTEVQAFLSGVKALYPNKKLTAIFQPHLFSRTRDFADGFAESLSLADSLILLDIYPAREEPIPGVTSDIIFKNVKCDEKVMIKDDELLDMIEKTKPELLVTIGAGNIDRFIEPIKQIFEA